MRFEEAKQLFGNVKRLDYGEWGPECDEWLGRLNSYAYVMELVAADVTLGRARAAWANHVRRYKDGFDPYNIKIRLASQSAAKGSRAGPVPHKLVLWAMTNAVAFASQAKEAFVIKGRRTRHPVLGIMVYVVAIALAAWLLLGADLGTGLAIGSLFALVESNVKPNIRFLNHPFAVSVSKLFLFVFINGLTLLSTTVFLNIVVGNNILWVFIHGTVLATFGLISRRLIFRLDDRVPV